jgi:uncharacterized protein involved in type VI secretion and phage assembly
MSGPPFWGKYRGTVSDANDLERKGRVKARVPDVFGQDDSGWAMPCVPVGGSGSGFFGVPEVGAGVWIEFERGDPEYPVWSGCWRGGTADFPTEILGTPEPQKHMMLLTQGGHSLLLDDTPGTGGITLETSGGQKITLKATGVEITDGTGGKITLDPTGIEINNGKGGSIKMMAKQVSVNEGALEVT